MQIAIIADTHLPRGRRRLPAACVDRLIEADLIIHAGDFATLEVLRELESYGDVVAVHGNVDSPELHALLPEQRIVEAVAGTRIGVVHDAGPRGRRLERLRRGFPDCQAVVFGHSHIPLHERAADGFQIFNPGSPTERRRSPRHTMGVARVAAAGDAAAAAEAGEGRRQPKITFELVALD